MKPLILALLLLPVLVSAQNVEPNQVVRQYDRFEDRTRYWTEPLIVKTGLDMRASFSFKGKGAGKDVEGFWLSFLSESSDWRFLKNAHLYCRVDGQSVDLGKPLAADSDVKTHYNSVSVSEILVFRVEYKLLNRIAIAKNVEIRLGDTEFSLHSDHRNAIKELLGKVQVVKVVK